MNSLSFQINPSLETNDHELRIIIDEVDWLGKDYLGLDPPDFFRQKSLFESGNLLIGRCDCGGIGCCDYEVEATISNETVVWTTFENVQLTFDKSDYFTLIEKASKDFSWEDLNRRVERLVGNIFINKLIENKYLFDWASARIEPNTIKLSFSKNGVQNILQFNWDGKSEDSALKNAQVFYQKHFKTK